VAFPSVSARTETALTSAGTSFTINFTQTTGHRVVIFLVLTTGVVVTWGDSFSEIGGASGLLHVAAKVLDGSEGGNVVASLSASTKAAAIAYNITDHDSGTDPFVNSPANSLDPEPCTPTGGPLDFLFLACCSSSQIEQADDDTWANTAPTNYGNLVQKTSGTGGAASTNCMLAAADRQVNTTTENPNAFTTDANSNPRSFVVAVYPTAAAAATSLLIPRRYRSRIIR
jgi:hypothetical protein